MRLLENATFIYFDQIGNISTVFSSLKVSVEKRSVTFWSFYFETVLVKNTHEGIQFSVKL